MVDVFFWCLDNLYLIFISRSVKMFNKSDLFRKIIACHRLPLTWSAIFANVERT